MELFIVNTHAQPNGDHEVHRSTCFFLPEEKNRVSLGYFNNCQEALVEARKIYPSSADGCHYCCPQCDYR